MCNNLAPTTFGTLLSYNKTLFYCLFTCTSCASHFFKLKNPNPMLGFVCKSCNTFHSINSPGITILSSNDPRYYFDYNFNIVDSILFFNRDKE